MIERRWRVLTALLAVTAALVLIHMVERYRAVRSPSGWTATSGAATPSAAAGPWAPRIGTSRWIVPPGATWRFEEGVDQWFLRAELAPGARLTVRHGDGGPGLQLMIGQDTTHVGAEGHICVGTLKPASGGSYAVVFERTQDGYTLRSGSDTIACTALVRSASPRIEVEGASVALLSIGVSEWPAGVPMSSLGWLGGVALVGFLWMMLLELELYRRVSWPVVIATGLPCAPAAVMLWAAPELGLAGMPAPLLLVGASLGLKLLTVGVGGRGPPKGEE